MNRARAVATRDLTLLAQAGMAVKSTVAFDRKEFSLVCLSRVPGPSQRYERAYAFSRSNLRITLPVDVIGISGMKAISRGYSCAESRVLTKVWISAASASEA